MKGKIAGFETMGLVDGPGVRFVVFMQGCPLRCAYCHNPEMWIESGASFELEPEDVLKRIKKYRPYFKENGGVTVSGGEPLLQVEFVKELFMLCKNEGIHTCLDTSGYGENYEELLDYCDLIILDVKELDFDKYKILTGKSIEKFKSFVEICNKKHKKMWIRQVIVPNYNDTKESVEKLKGFVQELENVEKIELLPYHSMATEKYKKLGIKYRLTDVPEMDKQKCKDLEKFLI